jgi:hypothetical protein
MRLPFTFKHWYHCGTKVCGQSYNKLNPSVCGQHSSILDVRSFSGADCDTHHYLAVAKVRERLAVSKQAAQTFDGKRFNLRKLNELEVRKRYQTEITKRFAALENMDNDGDINRAWENIKESIKTSVKESLGLHELRQHKPRFDEECLGFLDLRN